MAPRLLFAVLMMTAGPLSAALAADSIRETPLVRAVRQSRLSAVNIHTEKNAAEDRNARFFAPKSRRINGMGTGIVVDERGYIVTNYHVVQDVDLITATLHDGSSFDASVVSYDRRQDLAIIRIEAPEPLVVMPLGTSSDLMLAETVYAVGNAFGYEHTVTSGIISALHRDVEVDETQSYENLIQTDASINPGNSGGPLLNLNGEVIGINVAIRSGAQRIGFAIPIDDARRTIARLLSVERLNGHVHGLTTTDCKSAEERRLVVDDVAPGSSASAAGIVPGDVIHSVRGVPVTDGTDLERSLLDLEPGQSVEMRILRQGSTLARQYTRQARTTSVEARSSGKSADESQSVMRPASGSGNSGSAEGQQKARLPSLQRSESGSAGTEATAADRSWLMLGFRLEPLTDSERGMVTERSWPGGRGPVNYNGGMRVTDVRAGSPAATLLRKNDILLGLDGYECTSAENLEAILATERLSSGRRLKCQYLRPGMNPLEGSLQLVR
ncbi:MAG: trypsin-like peptidase domain-containing protein [Planctomycetota bacterium]